MSFSGQSWGNQSWCNQGWDNQGWDNQRWGNQNWGKDSDKCSDKGFGKGFDKGFGKGSKGFGKGSDKGFGKGSDKGVGKGSGKCLIRQCINGSLCSHLRDNKPCTYGHELDDCMAGIQARIALHQQQLAYWTDAETRLSRAGDLVPGGLFVLSKVYEESGGVLRVNTPPGFNEIGEGDDIGDDINGETDDGSWDTQTGSQPDAVQPDAVQSDNEPDAGSTSEPVDG
jgi:hypothetical protein